ncbi:hypothetical protein FQ775_23955 [Nitratireductor mangrovi]|uniref:Uncharacterized protein n=1 Tax=Nitratireductor mangrovi TaxID=2599600 RepID=A0A6H0DZU5_9HYPH|nr:hypothetical protein [Nitratireductor mangrovi]QIS94657.1 hypothetical protein FQ775_23955 [Nitratireductor mangrovi]
MRWVILIVSLALMTAYDAVYLDGELSREAIRELGTVTAVISERLS